MRKNFVRSFLAMVLALCIICTEWGMCGITVSAASSTLSISGASTISSINKGSSWTCKGTVSSSYALKEVRGTIYESDGMTVKYRKSVYPNSKSYTIQNGEIDKALLFNKLQAGTYHYTIVASDTSGVTKTLINNKFTVKGSDGSTLKITGASTISSLKQGNSWTCSGTVVSNYVLKEVRGTIYESDGITVKYRKSVYPNSKSYTIQNGEIDKALLFNKLQAGTYHYTIVASDASGRTLTLVNNKFTVSGNAASTLKIAGSNTINSLQQGSSWTCKGTISSNYNISHVGGYILGSDHNTIIYSKAAQPNAKSYSLANSAIDKALLFNKLSAGTYYYKITAHDVSGKRLTLIDSKFTVTQVTSTLKISGAGTPGTLTKGASWTCTGTISSNYVITNVSGYILDSSGKAKYSKPVEPNQTSFSLKNSAIDSALKFNTLDVGTYTYKITATDKSGKTLTLINSKFTVTQVTSTLKISGAGTPGTLTKGASWTCKGTISSNYNISHVGGYILGSDHNTIIYSKAAQPNAKSYSLANSAIDKALLFNKLSAGTYYYKITAHDVSGKRLTLIDSKFTVTQVTSTLKISGAGTPGTLTKGSRWTCTGTISSNYVITNVSGYILDSSGKAKYSKPISPNKTSFSLKNSAIDSALKFNTLDVGTYTYKITATDKSGKTLTLIDSKFTVTQVTSTLKISGAGTPRTLTKGSRWTCTGTISSNYVITNVSGYILDSSGKAKYSKPVEPNQTSFSLKNSAIDSALKFNNLDVGTYTYKITATDKSGKTLTLINSKFTVTQVTQVTSTLKISGAGTPGTLTKGSRWTCTGTISSNYVITNVSGYILDSSGKAKYSKPVSHNKTSFSLKNSAIDSALEFNNLGVGTYTYKITATDKSGKTATLVNAAFTVKEASSGGTEYTVSGFELNKTKIEDIGLMGYYVNGKYTKRDNIDDSCSAFALAYCRTMIDGIQYDYKQIYYPKVDFNTWRYTKYQYATEKKALRAIYDYINENNKPCIILVNQTSGSSQHFVAVYGYVNVSDPDNMTVNNLKVIESVAATKSNEHFLVGSEVSKRVKSLRQDSSKKYVVYKYKN